MNIGIQQACREKCTKYKERRYWVQKLLGDGQTQNPTANSSRFSTLRYDCCMVQRTRGLFVWREIFEIKGKIKTTRDLKRSLNWWKRATLQGKLQVQVHNWIGQPQGPLAPVGVWRPFPLASKRCPRGAHLGYWPSFVLWKNQSRLGDPFRTGSTLGFILVLGAHLWVKKGPDITNISALKRGGAGSPEPRLVGLA